jgi:hypothetical protein
VKIDFRHITLKDLAALISGKLSERGIDAILVGGACVSIYTENKYQSFDLDFVSHAAIKEITSALAEIGFQKKGMRYFKQKECPFFIEFIAPPAAIGDEPLKSEKNLKTKTGNIILLTPTDSVKDRLAAYYHWNDPQALEQALMVATAQRINVQEVKRWSEKEGHAEKYRQFLKRLRKK